MKVIFQNLKNSPRNLIRRCGYGEHADPHTGETSYTKRLGTGIFPKFHVYLADRADGAEVSLHLDQKHPSYGMSAMHSGEYDGPLIEREMERIRGIFQTAE